MTNMKFIFCFIALYIYIYTYQELKGKLLEELDFRLEGQNGERCYRELKHLGFVYVPRINWEMTTKVHVY